MDISILKIKKAMVFGLMFFLCTNVFGQNQSSKQEGPLQEYTYSTDATSFLDIKTNGTKFYHRLVQQYGEKNVMQEGSPYAEFVKFIDKWDPILSPYNYDFQEYFQSTGSGTRAHGQIITSCDWEELGPVTPSEGASYIEGIGHVEFIRIAKHDPSKMLVGSIYGGLFYSSNAGNLWTCVSDNWGSGGCSWAEFSEATPGIVVATTSTGQNSTSGKGSFIRDGGVMLSSDYGQNWTTLLSTDVLNTYHKLNKVIFNPNSSNEVYIAKTGGLYKYDNLGIPDEPFHLQLVEDFVTPGEFERTNCTDIEVIRNPDLFPDGTFMAVSVLGTNPHPDGDIVQSKAFVSTNGGASFFEVFTTIDILRGNFEVSPASFQDPGTLDEAVIHYYLQRKSPAHNQVWTLRLSDMTTTLLHNNTSTQNFGSSFAFGVNPFDDGKIIFSRSTGLYGTLDNFVTTGNAMSNSGLHDDKEHFVWHPYNENELWVATHGGVERSVDNGQTWEDMSLGLGTANVLTFDDVSGNPNKILTSLFHAGTIRLDNVYNQPIEDHSWKVFSGGDGLGAEIIEKEDHNFYFASSQYTSGGRYSTTYDATGSSLSGFSFGATWNAWFESNATGKAVFTPGPTDSGRIDVFRSDLIPNTAPTRYNISDFSITPGFTNPYRTRKIFSSLSNNDVLFASGWQNVEDADGNVLRDYYLMLNMKANSNNPAAITADWKEVMMTYDDGSSRNKIPFRDVASSYYIDGRYYIVTIGENNHGLGVKEKAVWRMDLNNDGSYNLIDISGNLPTCIIQGANDEAILVEKGTNEGLYVMFECGVYYLHGDNIDSGNYNWQQTGENLPNISKNGIIGNYSINKIRLGTDGRGLWEGCFVCPEENYRNESGVSTDKFIEVTNYITSNATINNGVDVKYRAGTYIELNPNFESKRGSDFTAFIHSCLPNGKNSFRSSKVDPWANVSVPTKVNANQFSSIGSLLISPNPTKNMAVISMKDLDLKIANSKVELYNMLGQKLEDFNTKEKSFEIDMSTYEKGIYLIKVTNGENTLTAKLLKE